MRSSPAVLFFVVAHLVLLGCRGDRDASPPATGELETVDVGAPPDALVDPDNDPVERRREAASLAGVLPSDFPDGLPAPAGASVIDLGERTVVFLVPADSATVGTRYGSRLASHGWVAERDGAYQRNEVRVEVLVERQGPSARVTVTY